MNEFNEKEKEKILESLIGSIDSDEHNDVEIILEDGAIKANKLILSRRSEYFQKMFNKNSHFKEQKESSVQFPCKKLIMKKILGHLYGGNLTVSGMSWSEVVELLNMLKYLLLQDALDVLVEYLADQVDEGKVSVKESLESLEMAHSLKFEEATIDLVYNITRNRNLGILLRDHSEVIPTLSKELFFKILHSAGCYNVDSFKFLLKLLVMNKETLTNKEMREIPQLFVLEHFDIDDLLGVVRSSNLFRDKDIFEAVKKVHKEVEDKYKDLRSKLRN